MTSPYSFRLSVSELAEFCCRSGDLSLGLERAPSAQEGQSGQRKLQQDRPPHYHKEYSVQDEWKSDRFTCILSGRIDGVQLEQIPLLEEIKTTYCTEVELPAAQRAVHLAQLKLYGALFLLNQQHPALQLRLLYLNLTDDTCFVVEETLCHKALQDFYSACKTRYMHWLTWQCEHWESRNSWLQSLPFPFTQFRSGQRSLSVQAYRDLRDGQRGLYQAATGLGKTSGVLYPALKILGEDRLRQIWYLTAKNSGQRSVLQALEQLGHGTETPLRVIVLTARERVCFCQPSSDADCSWQSAFFDKWISIRERLQRMHYWHADGLQEIARQHQLCPHQLTLQLLPWADIVIADYNYVFDPSVRLGEYLEQRARQIALLVDEAHNLPERARDMFSAQLQKKALLQAARMVSAPPLQRRIKHFIRRHFATAPMPDQVCEAPPATLTQALTNLTDVWQTWFAEQRWLVFPTDHFETLMACVRFLQRLQRWHPEDRFISRVDGQDAMLEIFCTDPAPQLDSLTQRFHSCLYFSGSLQPLDFFARAISQQGIQQQLDLPSPFPPQNQLTLTLPVNTRYDARAASLPAIAAIMQAVWRFNPGRYLVSFPSYQYLQAVQQHLQTCGTTLPLLVQNADRTGPDTQAFVDALAARPCLALVIAGGSFAEGLDLPDNLLQGVIIVGTCMPPPSRQRELIQQQFQQQGCNGFDFAFRFPGLNRVIQSAGRVIRSATDRGVVILVDDRFNRTDFRRHCPHHWQIKTLDSPQDLQQFLLAFQAADI